MVDGSAGSGNAVSVNPDGSRLCLRPPSVARRRRVLAAGAALDARQLPEGL